MGINEEDPVGFGVKTLNLLVLCVCVCVRASVRETESESERDRDRDLSTLPSQRNPKRRTGARG